jgi:hypothetical protein
MKLVMKYNRVGAAAVSSGASPHNKSLELSAATATPKGKLN